MGRLTAGRIRKWMGKLNIHVWRLLVGAIVISSVFAFLALCFIFPTFMALTWITLAAVALLGLTYTVGEFVREVINS